MRCWSAAINIKPKKGRIIAGIATMTYVEEWNTYGNLTNYLNISADNQKSDLFKLFRLPSHENKLSFIFLVYIY